jgi:GNAT superfamily N-acetyltransferase
VPRCARRTLALAHQNLGAQRLGALLCRTAQPQAARLWGDGDGGGGGEGDGDGGGEGDGDGGGEGDAIADAEAEAEAEAEAGPAAPAPGPAPALPPPDISRARVSRRRVAVALGVAQVWVAAAFRRRGVARGLLDAARRHAVFGCEVPRAALAFSQPTAGGLALAAAYLGTPHVPVYGAERE